MIAFDIEGVVCFKRDLIAKSASRKKDPKTKEQQKLESFKNSSTFKSARRQRQMLVEKKEKEVKSISHKSFSLRA